MMTDSLMNKIVDHEEKALNEAPDENGMLDGYKLFGGMAFNQMRSLPEKTKIKHLIGIYESRVLKKPTLIGCMVYETDTKKSFIRVAYEGSEAWRQVKADGDPEFRHSDHFIWLPIDPTIKHEVYEGVNYRYMGCFMEDGPWYFLPTPTTEQYEYLLKERDSWQS